MRGKTLNLNFHISKGKWIYLVSRIGSYNLKINVEHSNFKISSLGKIKNCRLKQSSCMICKKNSHSKINKCFTSQAKRISKEKCLFLKNEKKNLNFDSLLYLKKQVWSRGNIKCKNISSMIKYTEKSEMNVQKTNNSLEQLRD